MDHDRPLMTISELTGRALALDEGVVEALRHYIEYGLNPGSFGIACLLGNYDLAVSKAHEKLKQPHFGGQDIIFNMVSYASHFPRIMRGDAETIDKWMQHDGLEHAPSSVLVLCKLEWADQLFGKFRLPRRDDSNGSDRQK